VVHKIKLIAIVSAAAATAVTLTLVPLSAEAQPNQAGSPPALLTLGTTQASPPGSRAESAHRADVDTDLLQPDQANTVSVDVVDTTLRVALEPQPSGAPG
jgi:hypothetical protein